MSQTAEHTAPPTTAPTAPPTADATALRVERRTDGQLWLVRPDQPDVPVRVMRPFPWSAPDAYVSLLNADDHEEALIDDLAALDEASRAALQSALRDVTFVLEIERIESIDTEFEIRNWNVITRQGPFTFQTKHDTWPYPLPDGQLLLRDIESNLFRIPRPDTLDPHSRKLLWAFVD